MSRAKTNVDYLNDIKSWDTFSTQSVSDKLKETVSINDFGASLTNTEAANTIAATSALTKAYYVYVPEGTYKINIGQLDITRFVGPGIFLHEGNRISLTPVLSHEKLVQRSICEPFFGFNNGTTNTQIYTGAEFAPQGIAYADVNGVEKLYISQRTDGVSWEASERGRIVEFNYSSSGGVITHVSFSPELALGHMGDISSRVVGSTVYLYTPLRVYNDDNNNGGGKGISRVNWKGAATSQSDVTSYQLFGNTGSNHIFANFQKGVPAVSTDGKLMIIIANNSQGTGRYLFIYDRAQVEAATNTLNVLPKFGPVPIKKGLGEYGETLQGLCSDGKFIYVSWGFTPFRAIRVIAVYDMQGNQVGVVSYDGPLAQYTESQMLGEDSNLKFPASVEPEGCCLRGNELLTLNVDFFRNTADIVSWNGVNYACISSTNLGESPKNRGVWSRTSLAATKGEWDSSTTYAVLNSTKRTKKVYAIAAAVGAAREETLQKGLHDRLSGTANVSTAAVDTAFPRGYAYQISAFEEATGKYYNAASFTDNAWRIYDLNEGSDNTEYLALRYTSNPTNRLAQILSENNGISSGAYLSLYGTSSAANPGDVRISAVGSGGIRLMQDSLTKFALTPVENITYQLLRPLDDNTIALGTSTRKWSNVYSQQISVGDGVTNPDYLSLRYTTNSTTKFAHITPENGGVGVGGYVQLYNTTSASNPGDVRISSVGVGVIRLMQEGLTKFALTPVENVTYQSLRPVDDNTLALGTTTRKWSNIYTKQLTINPTSSETPASNGDVVFQLTSNTQLTIKVKGSDGIIRSANITLA